VFEVVRLTKRPVAKGLQPLGGCQRLTKVVSPRVWL